MVREKKVEMDDFTFRKRMDPFYTFEQFDKEYMKPRKRQKKIPR